MTVSWTVYIMSAACYDQISVVSELSCYTCKHLTEFDDFLGSI